MFQEILKQETLVDSLHEDMYNKGNMYIKWNYFIKT